MASDASVHNHYTITATLPGNQAVTLCQNMFRSAAISAKAGSYINTLAGCNGFSVDSSKNTTISFSFPREEYINTVSA